MKHLAGLVFKSCRSLACKLVLMLFIALSIAFHIHDFFLDHKNNESNWANASQSGWSSSKKAIEGNHFIPLVPYCQSEDLELVIIVCSAPQNFASRQAIRLTWGKNKTWTQKSQVYFIIGRSTVNISDMFVDIEKEEFGDIIHYDLYDSYENLTLKSVSLLKWVTTKCKHAKYVMKTDDDMFVNIPVLRKKLLQSTNPVELMGKLISFARPIRDKSSKWFVPYHMYPDDYYPNYLSGTGYVMSQHVAALLYNSSLSIPFLFLEDVFITGMSARHGNVIPMDSNLFTYAKQKKNSCIYVSIATAHRMTPKDLYEVWDLIHNSRYSCAATFWNSMKHE